MVPTNKAGSRRRSGGGGTDDCLSTLPLAPSRRREGETTLLQEVF